MDRCARSLLEELGHVVDSPYPVSLKNLHTALHDAGKDDLYQFVDSHPEQVKTLVVAVVEALPLWPYTLDVLAHLAGVRQLRDGILLAFPLLLNELLVRCDKHVAQPADLTKACTALLAFPLPPSIPLPAAAQSFFVRMFDTAVRNSSVEAIEPVHRILYGACDELVELLPHDILLRFCENLRLVMKGPKSVDDQALSLYCLAVIARLNRAHGDLGDFYHNERVMKVLHLVILQVIYCCRGDDALPVCTAVKHVSLACNVIDATTENTRQSWISSNSGNRMIVRKLQEKVSSQNMSPRLRLQALVFLNHFVKVEAMSERVVAVFQDLVLTYDRWLGADVQAGEVLEAAFRSLECRLSAEFWSNLFTSLLGPRSSANNTQFARYSASGIMVKVIQHRLHANAEIRLCMRQGLVAPTTLENLRSWLLLRTTDIHDSSLPETGPSLDLLSLLVATIAYDQQFPEHSSLLLGLLDQYRRDTTLSQHSERRRRIHSELSLWQDSHSVIEAGSSDTWRQRLAVELGLEARNRQESIERLMGRVCHDLEARCDEVERPLRQEEARHNETKIECRTLEQRVKQLEAQIHHKDVELSKVQDESMKREQALTTIESEHGSLLNRVEDLEKKLRHSTAEASKALSTLRTEFEEDKLDLRATIAYQEEEMLQKDARTLEIQQQLSKTIEDVQITKHVLEEERATKTTLLEELRIALDQEKKARCIKESEVSQLLEAKTAADGMQARLETAAALSEQLTRRLEAQIEDMRQSSERHIEELSAAHSKQANESKAEAAAQIHALQEDIVSITSAMTELRESTDHTLRTKDHEIRNIRHKHRQAVHEVKLKTAELLEVQDLRARLLAAIDLPIPGHNLEANTKRTLDEEETTNKSRRRLSRKPSVQPFPSNSSDSEMQVDSSISSSGSEKSSPVSKRSKPRQVFRTPFLQQPSRGAPSLRSAAQEDIANCRSPLREVTAKSKAFNIPLVLSPNRQPGTLTRKRERMDVWRAGVDTMRGAEDVLPIPTAELDFLSGMLSGQENERHSPSRKVGVGSLAVMDEDDFDGTTVDMHSS